MIIDIHTHIGTFLNFNLSIETLLKSMDKYNIAFALVSNLEGGEVDHDQNDLPIHKQSNQKESNEKLLKLVKNNKNKLGALLWIRPRNEDCDFELENMIKKNRNIIYGLKVHPYHSNFRFNDIKMHKYFDLAQKYDLVIVTHTASDESSHPKLVYEIAQKYPNIKFVMYHMGLGTNHEEAIDLISKLPNLYGDTSWVNPSKVTKAIDICGNHKILFGSDNPINGVDTYNNETFYSMYFDKKLKISPDIYDKLMFKNAIDLFKINI